MMGKPFWHSSQSAFSNMSLMWAGSSVARSCHAECAQLCAVPHVCPCLRATGRLPLEQGGERFGEHSIFLCECKLLCWLESSFWKHPSPTNTALCCTNRDAVAVPLHQCVSQWNCSWVASLGLTARSVFSPDLVAAVKERKTYPL